MVAPLTVALPVTVTMLETGATWRLLVPGLLPEELEGVVVLAGVLPPPPQLRLAAARHSIGRISADIAPGLRPPHRNVRCRTAVVAPGFVRAHRRTLGRTAALRARNRCSAPTMMPKATISTNAKPAPRGSPKHPELGSVMPDAGRVMVMVTGVADPAVADVGLAAQVALLKLEATAHEKLTVPLNPLVAVIFTVALPD